MSLKVTVLGCGSSGGVPLTGERWGLCDPNEPKNRRQRPSILIEYGGTTMLVDTGPDLRNQINGLGRGESALHIDGILYTHEHADHVNGIDDVRFQAYAQGGQIQAYACPRTRKVLEQRFDYIFRGVEGPKLTYPPILAMNDFPFDLQIGAMHIHSWDQEHGNITSRGIRVGNFAYSTDASAIAPEDLEALRGIDTWIVGCIRKEPHPSHAHLQQVMDWADIVQPRHLYFTHMTGLMDYQTWNAETPKNMACAWDGQVIEVKD